MLRIVQEAESLRADLSVTVQEDAAAYEAVLQAYKLPKDTEEQLRERSQVIERATWGAIRPPLAVARKSVEVLRLLLTGITHGNINALSDGGSGAALALASLRGACLNVRVNVASLAKSDETRQVVEELSLLEQQAAGLEQEIKEVMNRRGDLLF